MHGGGEDVSSGLADTDVRPVAGKAFIRMALGDPCKARRDEKVAHYFRIGQCNGLYN